MYSSPVLGDILIVDRWAEAPVPPGPLPIFSRIEVEMKLKPLYKPKLCVGALRAIAVAKEVFPYAQVVDVWRTVKPRPLRNTSFSGRRQAQHLHGGFLRDDEED